MERLTIKYIEMHVPKAACTINRFGEADDCLHCEDICRECEGDCEKCYLQECLNKLAEYEIAEENGLLFRLPCSIGEPIFVIPSLVNYKLNKLNHYEKNNRVYEQIVCNVVFIKNGYLLNTCDGFCNVRGSEYGKTWFLLKSEAEAALQAMEKECK